MATNKLQAGIDKFILDTEELEKLIMEKIQGMEKSGAA